MYTIEGVYIYYHWTSVGGSSIIQYFGMINQYFPIIQTDTTITYQWKVWDSNQNMYVDDTTNTTPIEGVTPVNGQVTINK